jgi:hypothetical protein
MPTPTSGIFNVLAAVAVTLTFSVCARSQGAESVLYDFTGTSGDGSYPAGVVSSGAGNLFGTTYSGGLYNGGTVFELVRGAGGAWRERVLYSFCSQPNCADGASPNGVVLDRAGNLYGTVGSGGAHQYDGAVFELKRGANNSWTEEVLYSFTGGADGFFPSANVILDAAGNVYGTTEGGGTGTACMIGSTPGCGTVFTLTRGAGGTWTESVLHSFTGSKSDGAVPMASLTFHGAGELFGTTFSGGADGSCSLEGTPGCGTVFQLKRQSNGTWVERVLHSFNFSKKDGVSPQASVTFDGSGNLYGTTESGGSTYVYGTVFQMTPGTGGKWSEKVLYSFTGVPDGELPVAGVVLDSAGDVYGTTDEGGTGTCSIGAGCGILFELTPGSNGTWAESVLYSFTGVDGAYPSSNLIWSAEASLYGVTGFGGTGPCVSGCGTVFQVVP